jgi:hypothetical protein
MPPRPPAEKHHWRQWLEALIRQHTVDIQRLWRRIRVGFAGGLFPGGAEPIPSPSVETTGDCSACDPLAATWQMTISGLTNAGSCANFAQYNGTFDLEYNTGSSLDCFFEWNGSYEFCDESVTTTLGTIYSLFYNASGPDGDGWYLSAGGVAGGTSHTFARYFLAKSSFDCLDTNVLAKTAEPSTGYLGNWPSTISLVPV